MHASKRMMAGWGQKWLSDLAKLYRHLGDQRTKKILTERIGLQVLYAQ